MSKATTVSDLLKNLRECHDMIQKIRETVILPENLYQDSVTVTNSAYEAILRAQRES